MNVPVAELLDRILDELAVTDLMTFARTSKRLQEMVYDDTRWVARLKLMGVWSDTEARQRFEESRQKKMEALNRHKSAAGQGTGANKETANGRSRVGGALFDVGLEEKRFARDAANGKKSTGLENGFEAISLSPSGTAEVSGDRVLDKNAALHVLDRARSVRGQARQEYGRIHGPLAPLYLDLVRSQTHTEPAVFRKFRDPLQQAKMLAQLRTFAKSDTIQGSQRREEILDSMSAAFENAALREFEQGYAALDVNGRMRRYAHVLIQLNGGAAAIDSYITNHWLMLHKPNLGNPLDCLYEAIPPDITLKPSHEFFQRLSVALNDEIKRTDAVFPTSVDVFTPFLDRIAEEIITEFITPLFDEAHSGNLESYLKVVPGVYQQARNFALSIKPAKCSPPDFKSKTSQIVNRTFEPHVDLYLQEELDSFTAKCRTEVSRWEKQLSEQEASAESLFMSNVNRQADKRDFLTSFKKVLMMPVTALPSMTTTKQSSSSTVSNTKDLHNDLDELRASTPSPSDNLRGNRHSISPRPEALPTTELAAKVAIMNSKLEGIGSLFSIEVALTLVHAAKSSIERAAPFVDLSGKLGEEAREQCETIFTQLLQILGLQHIKPGFDKAVEHLNLYNARDTTARTPAASDDKEPQIKVKPLVTFLELVNVGDLIQQMVDAFYAQELVAPRLTDRDDFLNPATKEKKKFEQMLDERVAAGLNRGIDVLIDEVEYVFATAQAPTDYNPSSTNQVGTPASSAAVVEVGPTPTARRIVAMVESHTTMLAGSSDKPLLDVFNQEVGLRLFNAVCKHLKRQRISVYGAIRLIADVNLYYDYVAGLKNRELLRYFGALRELVQLFLVDCSITSSGRPASTYGAGFGSSPSGKSSRKNSARPSNAKEIASIVADKERYAGILRAEEVYEFAERRADWLLIKKEVERAMFGFGCVLM